MSSHQLCSESEYYERQLRSESEYYERQLRYVNSYSEERFLLERVRDLRDRRERYEWARYTPPPLYLLPADICNRALTVCGVDLAKPEKTMEPKTNENAAIAVLEAKLAEHKKNVTSMATYVTSSETSQKAIKQIEAALKKLD